MTFEELRSLIEKSAEDYSRNSSSHRCFIEDASGFREGVTWTLLKLYQRGLLKLPKGDDE